MPDIFAEVPTIGVSRSKFPVKSFHKTSFNVGELVPIKIDEVLPGDTFDISCVGIARVASGFVKVPMDNLYMDIYAFFVPNRIIWKHWKEFMGENTSGPWTPQTQYQVPQVVIDDGVLKHNTILSHMLGIVAEKENKPLPETSISALPLRAYIKIWNEFFRDQNNQAPVLEYDDEQEVYCGGIPSLDYMDAVAGTTILPANKYHDYFTSALPNAQKGDPVTIGLKGGVSVYGDGTSTNALNNIKGVYSSSSGMKEKDLVFHFDGAGRPLVSMPADDSGYPVEGQNLNGFTGRIGYASLNGVSVTTINDLRIAFQLQRFLEKDLNGTRYIEVIKNHFNVTNPDYRLQRPEYLGHLKQMINVDQVLQTSATGASGTSTAQGNVSGYSLTGFKGNLFTKSFTEHGFVITLACVRYNHTYQEGINKMWYRKDKLDYYWPVFANIGEQPVLEKQIFAFNADHNDDVFGYQEAWAEYRYDINLISGQMNSNSETPLDVWHFGDKYSDRPTLSARWLQEDPTNINRTINVAHTVADQMLFDFMFTGSKVRAMPTYSIPGLVDHN